VVRRTLAPARPPRTDETDPFRAEKVPGLVELLLEGRPVLELHHDELRLTGDVFGQVDVAVTAPECASGDRAGSVVPSGIVKLKVWSVPP